MDDGAPAFLPTIDEEEEEEEEAGLCAHVSSGTHDLCPGSSDNSRPEASLGVGKSESKGALRCVVTGSCSWDSPSRRLGVVVAAGLNHVVESNA